MVDGVHGHMENVVSHVVEEHLQLLEYVIILHRIVEEGIALAWVSTMMNAILSAVLVR